MLQGSSSAKFILSGEHSIIHGGSALAFPLNQLKLSYREEEGPEEIILNGEFLEKKHYQNIVELRKLFNISTPLKKIYIESNIPLGAGLGSSAALCHAILKAHQINEKATLLRLCHKGEMLFHGQSSGLDPYTIVHGVPLEFSKNLNCQELNTRSFKNSEDQFILVNTNHTHNTKESVHQQTQLKKENFSQWKHCMQQLIQLSKQMKSAFEQTPHEIAPLMEAIHQELKSLGLSHHSIENTILKLKSLGAKAAKLTGAGQGGFVLALFEKEKISQIDWKNTFPKQQVIIHCL